MKFIFYIFILISFLLPFSMLSSLHPEEELTIITILTQTQWISIFIGVLIVIWISEGKWRKKWEKIQQSPLLWLFIGFYIIQCFGILNTTNLEDETHELMVKFTLFLFPLILATTQENLKESQINNIFWSFTISVGLVSLLTFREGFSVILDTEAGIPVLQKSMLMHRPYLGLYILLVIFFLLNRITRNTSAQFEKLLVLLVILFIAFLFIIQAKMAIIAFIFTSFILFSIVLIKRQKINILLLSGIVFLGIGYLSYPYTEYYIHDLTNINLIDQHINNPDLQIQQNPRPAIWNCAVEIIKNNFWVGVGTGDVQEHLNVCYEVKNLDYQRQNNLNAHNEFLQEGIRHGVIGFSLFIVVLVFPVVVSIQRRLYLYTAFLLIFGCCCITETILSRQSGAIFYSFFNALLAFQYPRKNQ